MADEAISNGHVAATYAKREAYWNHWCNYVHPLGLNLYLQHDYFANKVRAETGFDGWVWT